MIVGGGTAGLTLACRLAASPSVTVAVIEAGGFYELDNGNLSQIPSDAIYWVDAAPKTRNPLIDWYQFTTPQPVGLRLRSGVLKLNSLIFRGLEEEPSIIPRGRH